MPTRSTVLTKELWWFIVLSGAASVVFGAVALFWPKLTLVTLVFLFAVFVLVAGLVELFSALKNIKGNRLWWLSLLLAVVNIAIGVYLVRNPLVTAVVFVMLLAAAIGVRAIFDLIVASYADRNEHKWLWVASGVLGLIAAVVILVYPVSASVTFVWVLGLYTLIHGVIALAYAAQIRGDVKKAK